MNCPRCKNEIGKENINIMTDVGQCPHCDHIFKISENLTNETADGFDMNNPPKGAWIRRELDHTVIGATTRSPIAFFLVPFMIVWSGGAIGGIYGTQILSGDFDPFLSLFGIPFIIGAILFWSLTVMVIWGKVEMTLDKEGGKIFTGVGSLGLTKRFTWDEISSVKENESNFRYPGSQGGDILLEGKKRISFGKGVNETRRYYLFRSLKSIIGKVKSNRKFL